MKYQSCSINHLIARIDIKNNISLLKVKQKFNYQYTEDIPGEIGKEFYRICLDRKIRPGMKIAITAGSRVIDRITKILQSIIKVVKIIKTEPFIVTTMCSHGRATAEGRCKVFSHYGITEKSMGVPIKVTMDTAQLDYLENDLPVHFDPTVSLLLGFILGRCQNII